MSGAPVLERSGREAGPTDHELVSAVRRGDDRAFEVLYSRYQRRIAAYVFGMVKDHGRAEDITQEVFVSALRRMRQTERPIAFKPWIYEIAKNACIDAYRRQRRAEEVSFDADDRLSAADHGRLVATAPEPDAAVDAKQELDLLCGAFGGLSDSHHQILVMRELEGRSYKDIGERMGMSRPAVESTLFRARKRLGEEYDELASGARCLRIQAIIVEAGEARARRCATSAGSRATSRTASRAGGSPPRPALDVPVPARTRVAGKLAAWLPLPGVPAAAARRRRRSRRRRRRRRGPRGWLAHVPAFADSMSTGWGKAAAGLAALARGRRRRRRHDAARAATSATSAARATGPPRSGRSTATATGGPAARDAGRRGRRAPTRARAGAVRSRPRAGRRPRRRRRLRVARRRRRRRRGDGAAHRRRRPRPAATPRPSAAGRRRRRRRGRPAARRAPAAAAGKLAGPGARRRRGAGPGDGRQRRPDRAERRAERAADGRQGRSRT